MHTRSGDRAALLRVGVIDEHEIFRRGLVTCLEEDGSIEVVFEGAKGPLRGDPAVAVVSPDEARTSRFDCPLVVCASGDSPHVRRARHAARSNRVAGVLPRSSLTADQLAATVRAAAAGLQVTAEPESTESERAMDDRNLRVLQLLAEGSDTREIARSLSYSERTIKTLIREVEHQLGARSRAHAVAEGIRQGLV
ncbi:MAG TPA: LuxR C-terminal-related transcriptional regulator [Thermoleophilaceae bacterium]